MTNAVKKAEASPSAREKGARVFPIPPPLYYGAAFAGGMFLHGAVPLEVPGRPATALAGAALLSPDWCSTPPASPQSSLTGPQSSRTGRCSR